MTLLLFQSGANTSDPCCRYHHTRHNAHIICKPAGNRQDDFACYQPFPRSGRQNRDHIHPSRSTAAEYQGSCHRQCLRISHRRRTQLSGAQETCGCRHRLRKRLHQTIPRFGYHGSISGRSLQGHLPCSSEQSDGYGYRYNIGGYRLFCHGVHHQSDHERGACSNPERRINLQSRCQDAPHKIAFAQIGKFAQ